MILHFFKLFPWDIAYAQLAHSYGLGWCRPDKESSRENVQKNISVQGFNTRSQWIVFVHKWTLEKVVSTQHRKKIFLLILIYALNLTDTFALSYTYTKSFK